MGQNKAVLWQFFKSVHKRRNCNSCNTSDLHFICFNTIIFLQFSTHFLALYETKWANRTYITTCYFTDFWKMKNYM